MTPDPRRPDPVPAGAVPPDEPTVAAASPDPVPRGTPTSHAGMRRPMAGLDLSPPLWAGLVGAWAVTSAVIVLLLRRLVETGGLH